MINSTQSIYNIMRVTNQINDMHKVIARDGLEDTTENLFYKLRNDDIQHIKKIELKGIAAAEVKYQHYDNIFKDMGTTLGVFRSKITHKLSDINNDNGMNAINIEMNGLKENFKRLVDIKIDNEKIFDHNSELLIGDGIRVPRTFDKKYIQVEGKEITDMLQSFIDSDNPSLEEFDKIVDTISVKQAEVGARWSGLKSTKSIYENIQFTENEFMSKRYKLIESYQQLNELSVTYEALLKTVAKMSSLSLVDYV